MQATPRVTPKWVNLVGKADNEDIGTTSRLLPPTDVLDMHARLHGLFARPTARTRQIFTEYALNETDGYPQWQASHLHPATSRNDLEPWLKSLGDDLANAETYQVTAEMIDLAQALQEGTPDLDEIREEDLPSDAGFMWLDKPIPRPSIEDDEDHPPLLMHAISWKRVDTKIRARLAVDNMATPFETELPAVRIREWGYTDRLDVEPRPLYLIGQSTAITGAQIRSPLPELKTVHMLWILMGMTITATQVRQPGRQGKKRAAKLSNPDIRVITLRRPAHRAEPTGEHRDVDWSCTWVVRKHARHLEDYKPLGHGHHLAIVDKPGGPCKVCHTRTTHVRAHIKGPDGLPLRLTDILYKLAR